MKRTLFLFLVAAAVLASSCNKPLANVAEPDEIVFGIEGDGIDIDVLTKAAAVTSVASVYWQCLDGGSNVYGPLSCTVTTGTAYTTKYWPAAGATYDYRVSNVSFTSAGVIAATNETDIIAGTASSVTNNSCTVTLDHIFARTGSLTLNTQAGYEVSGITWRIKAKGSGVVGTAGNYTIGTGWAASGNTGLTSYQEFTGSSDLYLIPGTYQIELSYTLTKNEYTQSFTKHSEVTLQAGKINNIAATAVGGAASELTFTVSITGWAEENLPALILTD